MAKKAAKHKKKHESKATKSEDAKGKRPQHRLAETTNEGAIVSVGALDNTIRTSESKSVDPEKVAELEYDQARSELAARQSELLHLNVSTASRASWLEARDRVRQAWREVDRARVILR